MKDELPQGWAEVELPEIALLNMGQSPPSNTYNREGRGLPFFQGKAEFGNFYPAAEKFCSTPMKIAEPDDILISVRAPVGPTNLCRERSCIGRGLAAIRPLGEIPSRYLLFYLRSIEDWLATQGTGSTFTAISKSDLEQLRIHLAPLAEQRRIVARLENLLGKVETCQKRLETIPVLLKRFRQSVLAAACSGRLSADWRKQTSPDQLILDQPANLKEICEVEGIFEVEDYWRWLPLCSLCYPSRSICYGVIKLGSDVSDGIPCLRTSDVKPLLIDTTNVKRIAPEISQQYRRTTLQGGEVLVNVRGTLGGVAAVPDALCGWNVSREIAVVPVAKVIPKFIEFWIASVPCQNWLTGVAKGVAYTGINIEDLRLLPVALPSLAEQEEIVRRVEKLFKLADTIEARYAKAKAFVDKLTQSILAKAFRGQLVPQDPNDESASALLGRIQKAAILCKKYPEKNALDRLKKSDIFRRMEG